MVSFGLVPNLGKFVSEDKYSSEVKRRVEEQFLGSFLLQVGSLLCTALNILYKSWMILVSKISK